MITIFLAFCIVVVIWLLIIAYYELKTNTCRECWHAKTFHYHHDLFCIKCPDEVCGSMHDEQ